MRAAGADPLAWAMPSRVVVRQLFDAIIVDQNDLQSSIWLIDQRLNALAQVWACIEDRYYDAYCFHWVIVVLVELVRLVLITASNTSMNCSACR